MKRSSIGVVWVAAVLIAGGLAMAAEALYVQASQGAIRAKATCLGEVMGRLEYGTEVAVIEEKGPWRRVQVSGKSGWMHESTLSGKKREPLKAGQEDVESEASGDGIPAIAAKGFTEQVEDKWLAQNSALDYGWVDRMEGFDVPDASMIEFLAAGEVSPSEGGGS